MQSDEEKALLFQNCIEYCGDGKLLGSEGIECDDGNTINNDGCNEFC